MSEQEDGEKSSLTKKAGWRQPSSKTKMSPNRHRNEANSDDGGLMDPVTSETSISSNGPLKELIRGGKENGPHLTEQAKIHFKPSKELFEVAMQQSDSLAKIPVRDPSLDSLQSGKVKRRVEKLPSRDDALPPGSSVCPLNPVGGYKMNTLSHVKMVQVICDDDEEELFIEGVEKSSKSCKTNRTMKAKGGKSASKRSVHPKTATFGIKQKPKSQSDAK